MSSNSSSSTTTTMGLSSAVLAVIAASAVSYYYHSSSTNNKKFTDETTTTITSRDITTSTATDPTTINRLGRWEDRWSSGKIQWHKSEIHASLQKYCDTDLINEIIGGGGRILVPLCGKTIDMVYLARKRVISEVVGIDGVPKAIEEFIQEQSSEFEFQTVPETDIHGYTKHTAESITLITGDFFDITLDVINNRGSTSTSTTTTMATAAPSLLFDGVWDRGSFVAIDPSLRERYIDQIGTFITKPNGKYLLSTVLRPNNDTTTGPPYSVNEAEIRRLFGTKSWVGNITLLESHSFLSLEPSWYKAMTTYLRMGNIKEEIYIITTK